MQPFRPTETSCSKDLLPRRHQSSRRRIYTQQSEHSLCQTNVNISQWLGATQFGLRKRNRVNSKRVPGKFHVSLMVSASRLQIEDRQKDNTKEEPLELISQLKKEAELLDCEDDTRRLGQALKQTNSQIVSLRQMSSFKAQKKFSIMELSRKKIKGLDQKVYPRTQTSYDFSTSQLMERTAMLWHRKKQTKNGQSMAIRLIQQNLKTSEVIR